MAILGVWFASGGSLSSSLLSGRVPRTIFRDRKGTPKNFCDKDFAELSGELSGAICLKTLVLMGNDRYPPRTVQKILWYCSCDFFGFGVLVWLLNLLEK